MGMDDYGFIEHVSSEEEIKEAQETFDTNWRVFGEMVKPVMNLNTETDKPKLPEGPYDYRL